MHSTVLGTECPLLFQDLPRRICSDCGIYFPSITAKVQHTAGVHRRKVNTLDAQAEDSGAEDCQHDDVEDVHSDEGLVSEDEDSLPIVGIFDIMQNPFAD